MRRDVGGPWLVRVGDPEKGPFVVHEGFASPAGVVDAPPGPPGTFHLGHALVTKRRKLAAVYEDEVHAAYVRGFVEAAAGKQAWPFRARDERPLPCPCRPGCPAVCPRFGEVSAAAAACSCHVCRAVDDERPEPAPERGSQ